MSRPLLAICVPTYGRAALLDGLLAGLAAQGAGTAELPVLVADNASPDETPAVLAAWARRLPGLSVHRQSENVGSPQNVRWLMANAPDVDYVWVFGDDDRPVAGAVGRVRAILGDRRIDLLHLPHAFVVPDGRAVATSPCPGALTEHAGSAELYRATGHWITFLSALVVRADRVRTVAAASGSRSRYGPAVWALASARDGLCAVAGERLVEGSTDISWNDVRADVLTHDYVGLYDEGLGGLLDPEAFGASLDELYAPPEVLALWGARPIEEEAAAAARFRSRRIAWHLLHRSLEEGRPELLDAVRAAGDRPRAETLLAEAEERFVAGDGDAALAAAGAAVQADPANASAWNDLGVVLHATGGSGAADALALAIRLDPAHADARANLESIGGR